jgi:hypothetical protein
MNEPNQNLGPFGRAVQKLFSGISLGCGLLWLGFLVIAVVVIAFSTTWAAIIIFVALWFICLCAVAFDKEPWEASRFLSALLVAWGIDTLLFRLSVAQAPRYYRHFSPAVIVISIVAGYITWRLTADVARDHKGEKDAVPFALFGSFLVAAFLMVYVISPTMGHFFPYYWHNVTNFVGEDEDN